MLVAVAPVSGLVAFVFHHLVVDAVSWRLLLGDLLSLYMHHKTGLALTLAPKTASFQTWTTHLQTWATAPALKEAEGPYWARQFAEGTPTRLPRATGGSSGDNTRGAPIVLRYTAAETAAVVSLCGAAYRCSAEELLLAGLTRGFHRQFGDDRPLIDLEVCGRDCFVLPSACGQGPRVPWGPGDTAVCAAWVQTPAVEQVLRQRKKNLCNCTDRLHLEIQQRSPLSPDIRTARRALPPTKHQTSPPTELTTEVGVGTMFYRMDTFSCPE